MDYSREINKLSEMLTTVGIAHEVRDLFDGYQILTDTWDVVCHGFSYGNKRGLLEGYKGPFVTEYDDVTGYLTAEQAFELIINYK